MDSLPEGTVQICEQPISRASGLVSICARASEVLECSSPSNHSHQHKRVRHQLESRTSLSLMRERT